MIILSNIKELLSFIPDREVEIKVKNYWSHNDYGGGSFIWAPYSEAKVDNGLVFKPNSAKMGRWIRKFAGPIYVEWFGARGNGLNDDTQSIQAAINTGFDVYFTSRNRTVKPIYLVSRALSGMSSQKIYSDLDGPIIHQTNSYEPILKFENCTNFSVQHLNLRASGKTKAMKDGVGLYLENSNYGNVKNCTISNCAGIAIMLVNSNECNIIENSIVSAAKNSSGSDIWVGYSSSKNKILNNKCISGTDQGICIQAINEGDMCCDNLIKGNIVDNHNRYGILVYRKHQKSFVLRNIVESNNISYVKGSTPNIALKRVFGSGIYIQGAEYSRVCNNIVKNTNQFTDTELLGPAGIGITNVTNVYICQNKIMNCNYYGIIVADPNQFGSGRFLNGMFFSTGNVTIVDNDIYNSGKTGIYIKAHHNVNIIRNKVIDSKNNGILLNSVDKKYAISGIRNFIIKDNIIENSKSSGISLVNVINAVLEDNNIDESGVDGISILNGSNYITIRNNKIQKYKRYKIYYPDKNRKDS